MEEHYSRQEIIGRGNFGVVYKGQHIPSGKVVAIKVLNLDTINDDVEDVQREIALLALLSKKESNIIKYYESFLAGTKLWIIMDLCAGGSIRTLLKAGPLGDKHLSVVFREVLVAISHMHHEGIIHRDIKAANILITLEGNVRVCDFGVAADTDINRTKRTTLVGTPYWMAPEVVIEGQEYNTKADIWSAGITLFEMATGNPPYSEQEAVRALLMISKGRPPRLEGPKYSSLLKDVVALCLDEDPNVRPTAEDLLKHKFIKQYQKLGTFVLRELIERFKLWQQRSNNRRDSLVGVEEDMDNLSIDSGAAWDFDDIDETGGEVFEYMGEAPRSLGELFEGEGATEPLLQAAPTGHNPAPTLLPHSQAPAVPAGAVQQQSSSQTLNGPEHEQPSNGIHPLASAAAIAASRKPASLQTQLPLHSGTSTPTSATFGAVPPQSQSQSQSLPQAQSQPLPQSQSQVQSQVQSQPQSQAQSQPQSQPQHQPQLQSHAQTQSQPQPQPQQQPAASMLGSAYSTRSVPTLPPTDLNHPLRLNRAKSQRGPLMGPANSGNSQSSTSISTLQTSPGRDTQRSRALSYGNIPPNSPGRIARAAPAQVPSGQGQSQAPNPGQAQLKMPSRLGMRMMSAPKLPGLGRANLQSPTQLVGFRSKFPAVPPLDMAFLSDATPKQAVASQLSLVLESFSAGLKCLEARLSEPGVHA